MNGVVRDMIKCLQMEREEALCCILNIDLTSVTRHSLLFHFNCHCRTLCLQHVGEKTKSYVLYKNSNWVLLDSCVIKIQHLISGTAKAVPFTTRGYSDMHIVKEQKSIELNS